MTFSKKETVSIITSVALASFNGQSSFVSCLRVDRTCLDWSRWGGVERSDQDLVHIRSGEMLHLPFKRTLILVSRLLYKAKRPDGYGAAWGPSVRRGSHVHLYQLSLHDREPAVAERDTHPIHVTIH
jgi:hypothetical protein